MAKPHPKSATKAAVRAQQLAWLGDLERWLGKSLSRVASEAGLSDTTLTRLRRSDDDGTLNDVSIQAIKTRHGVPGPYDQPADRAMFLREEAVPYVATPDADPFVKRAIDALLGKRDAFFLYTLKTRALELAGYLPGDIVLVSQNHPARDGDIVCAQVVDSRTGTAETVWRAYLRVGGVITLAPRALDSSAFTSYIVDDDRVSVAGVVAGMVRPGRA